MAKKTKEAKKTQMAKEVEKTETENDVTVGKQGYLPDVRPKNEKQILEKIQTYKKYQAARLKALDKETELKQEILDLIHKSGLKRLDDGKIKFKCENFIVTVEPTDEKIKIKEEGD